MKEKTDRLIGILLIGGFVSILPLGIICETIVKWREAGNSVAIAQQTTATAGMEFLFGMARGMIVMALLTAIVGFALMLRNTQTKARKTNPGYAMTVSEAEWRVVR